MGAPAPLLWTTTAQASYPADAGVSLNNASGSYQNSAWGEVIATTPTAWKITSLYYSANSNGLGYVEFDLGIGAAGSEVVVATVSGFEGLGTVLALPVPAVLAAAGSRVAIRLRTSDHLGIFTFAVGVLYQGAPFSGTDASTTAPIFVLPSVITTPPAAFTEGGLVVTSNATAWVPGSWVAFTTNVPAAMTLGALFSYGAQSGSSAFAAIQFDIGIGPSGAQTVLTSLRWSSNYVNNSGTYLAKIFPLVSVPAGSQLWCRVRDTLSTAESNHVALYLYPTASELATVSTTQPMIWAPAAADGVTITSGGSAWVNGSWVEVLSATTTTAAALQLLIASCPVGEAEIDVGVGASGSETVLTTFRTTAGSFTNMADHSALTLAAGVPIAPGQRIALRVRSTSTASNWRVALGYIESPTFDQIDATAQQVYPPSAAGVTCTPPGVAYSNSAWGELVSATASAIRITGLSFTYTTTATVLVDIASGESGSEVVLTTLRAVSATANLLWFPFVTPYYVESGVRLSVRVRQSDNSATPRLVAVTYLGVPSLPPQPPPPATTRTPIRFVRQGPTLADEDNHHNVRWNRLELLVSSGLGAQALQEQHSDDNGFSWSALQTFGVSEIGEYQARARLFQLGTSRQRIYRIIHTADVPLTILDQLADFMVLNS